MSSKARSVEHGGVTWKVIPGSRREQLLERMIRQDNMLHHANPASVDIVEDDPLYSTIWGVIGLLVGASATAALWWLI